MLYILIIVAFVVFFVTTMFFDDIYKLYLYKKFPKEIPFEQFKYLDRKSYVELTTVEYIYVDFNDYNDNYNINQKNEYNEEYEELEVSINKENAVEFFN